MIGCSWLVVNTSLYCARPQPGRESDCPALPEPRRLLRWSHAGPPSDLWTLTSTSLGSRALGCGGPVWVPACPGVWVWGQAHISRLSSWGSRFPVLVPKGSFKPLASFGRCHQLLGWEVLEGLGHRVPCAHVCTAQQRSEDTVSLRKHVEKGEALGPRWAALSPSAWAAEAPRPSLAASFGSRESEELFVVPGGAVLKPVSLGRRECAAGAGSLGPRGPRLRSAGPLRFLTLCRLVLPSGLTWQQGRLMVSGPGVGLTWCWGVDSSTWSPARGKRGAGHKSQGAGVPAPHCTAPPTARMESR